MTPEPSSDAARDGDCLVRTEGLTKRYRVRTGLLSRVANPRVEKGTIEAVSDLNIEIRRGEVLGLAGESGSGKSTTGLLLTLLERPTEGKVLYDGTDVATLRGRRAMKRFRREVQIVFQDPSDSLNPRYTVERTLTEPLRIHRSGTSRRERQDAVAEMLDMVELRPWGDFVDRYPHELSGGQRQRVAIARAVILRPTFIVADEPISMLDVSVRVGLMNLMLNLKEELGMTYLFITHDLAAARYMCDRIAVMRYGKIVESGAADEVLHNPQDAYTRQLLKAVPDPGKHRDSDGSQRLTMS